MHLGKNTGAGLPAGYLQVCSQRRIQTWICGNPVPKGTRTRGSNYLQVFPQVYLQVTCVDLDPRPALSRTHIFYLIFLYFIWIYLIKYSCLSPYH